VPNVRVIRGEDSSDSSVMTTEDALALAFEAGLDLVEVGPNQNPPVCRIIDYGRFRYIQNKRDKQSKRSSRSVSQREVRIRPRISENDIQSKIRTVKSLLSQGSKVRVSVMFRGREQTHPEIGIKVLRKVAEGVKEDAKLERAPAMEARSLSIILAPLGKGQIKTNAEPQQAEKTFL